MPETQPIAVVSKKDTGFSFSSLFSVVGTLAASVVSIFTSGDKVKIAQTEVDIARESVNAIKAQGDIEQTKLAEKALDVRIAQYNAIASKNKNANNLSKTKTIGFIVVGLAILILSYFAFKTWSKNRLISIQQNPYYNLNTDNNLSYSVPIPIAPSNLPLVAAR